MRKQKVIVSIIIVHYRAKEELFSCLSSLKASSPYLPYEVIVVDNDEKKIIEGELRSRFGWVSYIATFKNCGFGAGNNIGAGKARGKFLFFLNPDTVVLPRSIDNLIQFLSNQRRAAIVAPLLLNNEGTKYALQGSMELTPLAGIVCLSFINKLFPNNPISKKYFLSAWDKKSLKEVDVVPGAAFVIHKSIFEEIGGFDERFFLYFEESDLCRRVKQKGYTIYMLPHASIVHGGGATTRTRDQREIISAFRRSRWLYFQKHFGLIPAIAVHMATSLRRKQ